MNNHERYVPMIQRIDQELGWQLDPHTHMRYAELIAAHVPDMCSESALRTIILNYHLDHAQVEAMRDCQNSDYERQWASWLAQVGLVLRQNSLHWSSDRLFDQDDLEQIALNELVLAIPTFHFASRFKTWVYKVIVHSVRRALRDQQAKKRAGRPESLDQLFHRIDRPPEDADQLENEAHAKVLWQLIEQILMQEANARLAYIVDLYMRQDQSVEEIGKRIHLHPSRVRNLIHQARHILQNSPELLDWVSDVKTIPCEK